MVDPAGGLETPLELLEGWYSASLSADGNEDRLYADRPRVPYLEARPRRARAGRLDYDFAADRSERLTDYPATDNFPMWVGNTIYFTSDREHAMNIYAYDLATKVVAKSRASPSIRVRGRASGRAPSSS